MPRRSNARSKANVDNTPPFSPPTQLPTPLPEQQSVISNDDQHTLIDLETPPSTGSVSLPDEDTNIYRSPPFREAQLPPEDSPPPLPILPRMRHDSSEFDLGHTRAPKFSRCVFVSLGPCTCFGSVLEAGSVPCFNPSVT